MKTFHFKLLIIGVELLVLVACFPWVQADFGPKRTTEVYISGIDEAYSFDILIQKTTPVIPIDLTIFNDINYGYYQDEYPLTPLNGFQDDDGFVSYSLYNSAPACIIDQGSKNGVHHFTLGYYMAPKTFKIAIYTESGILVISKAITTETFYSKVTFDLSGVSLSTNQTDVGIINHGNVTMLVMLDLIIRLLLTLGIEMGLFYFFKYRLKDSYLKVGIINGITQITLTLFVVLFYYFWGAAFGAILILFFGELIVFLIEGISYPLLLKEQSRKKAIFYALSANSLSFLLTLLSIPLFLYP